MSQRDLSTNDIIKLPYAYPCLVRTSSSYFFLKSQIARKKVIPYLEANMSDSTISILWNCRPSIARPNLSNLYLLLDFLWMTHSLQSTRNSPIYNKGSLKTHQECKSEVVWLTQSIQMAAGESVERAGNGNDHEGSLGKKRRMELRGAQFGVS